MRKIEIDGSKVTLIAWCIYVASATVYIWLSSLGIESNDPGEVDEAFWARIYVAYSFPLFVLALWGLSGASRKPASTIWLISLSALSFIVIFGIAHLFMQT